MLVLNLSVVAIVCVTPGTIPPVGGGAIGNGPSWTSKAGEPIVFGGAILSAPLTVRAGGISFGTCDFPAGRHASRKEPL